MFTLYKVTFQQQRDIVRLSGMDPARDGPARDRGWAWPVGMSDLSAVPLQRGEQSGAGERSVWPQK